MDPVRRLVAEQVLALFGPAEGRPVDLDTPRGDPGLFGPGSMVWKVHADFTAMMIGGVASLLVQMLHPAALAGVWDHSDFRGDMRGRLRRTAQFVAGTSYGARGEAERLIARVRNIHQHVRGTLPDGTPYAANDPALLTWVHAAEAWCFLAAYRRYRDPGVSGADQDRYLAEVAEVARLLGAADVPADRRDLERYFSGVRPALAYDGRTAEITRSVLDQPPPSALAAPFRALVLAAAVDLLPPWAAALHGFAPGETRRRLTRSSAGGVGAVLRWALTDGSARRAARRVGLAA